MDVLKFLVMFFPTQNSVPTNPVEPQSRSDAQFIGVFMHWLMTVPGFRHWSIVLGFWSSQSESLLHEEVTHSPFRQRKSQVLLTFEEIEEEQKERAVAGRLQVKDLNCWITSLPEQDLFPNRASMPQSEFWKQVIGLFVQKDSGVAGLWQISSVD
jgi:hypothetical protein